MPAAMSEFPREFDRSLIRFRTGIAEKDAIERFASSRARFAAGS
jgi:hypothetical protein